MIDILDFPKSERAPIDLTGALDASLRESHPSRGDEHFAHFSDLGGCDHQIWARRRGKVPPASAKPGKPFLFSVGFHGEDVMGEALHARFGEDYHIEHGGVVTAELQPDGDFVFDYLSDVFQPHLSQGMDPATTVIGHPDFVLTPLKGDGPVLVIDTKTTAFNMQGGVRQAPGYAKPEYVLATAGYAVAVGAEHFGIWSACKQGAGDECVWYDTADYRPLILRRLRELLTVTAPDAPAPEPMPPPFTVSVVSRGPRKGEVESWYCNYCDFTGCVRNQKVPE